MVTLKDIANATGLSIGTVSGVLNSPYVVKYAEETRVKVRQAAEDLGYTPNRMAQSLRMGNSRTIGLLAHGTANPYSASIIEALSKRAQESGYSLIIEQTDPHQDALEEAARIRELMGLNVAAIVAWIAHHDAHHNIYDILRKRKVPLFVLGMPTKRIPTEGVRINYEKALTMLAEKLVALGHHKIAHVGSVPWSDALPRRFRFFRKKLEEHGIQFDQKNTCPVGLSLPDIKRDTKIWLKDRKKEDQLPSAILCINDITAIGTIRAVTELGLRVPEDISVIGIDGVEIGQYLPKKLSTLAIDFDALAQHTVRAVMRQVEKGSSSRNRTQMRIFEAKFLKGETLGPAKTKV